MELKRLISHYRIEPKPGGGFIAQAADPSVVPLKAPTREELQKKIQGNRKPEGGFVISKSAIIRGLERAH